MTEDERLRSRDGRWNPASILQPRTSDGRPLWEPPVLDYSHLIDTKDGEQYYTKRMEAAMNFTRGDVGEATRIMDYDNEQTIVWDYLRWANDEKNAASDMEERSFFEGLVRELREDCSNLEDEYGSGQLVPAYMFNMRADGPWVLHLRTKRRIYASSSSESEAELSNDDSSQISSEDGQPENSGGEPAIANVTSSFSPSSLGSTTTIAPGLHLSLDINQGHGHADSMVPSQLAHQLVSLRSQTNEADDVD